MSTVTSDEVGVLMTKRCFLIFEELAYFSLEVIFECHIDYFVLRLSHDVVSQLESLSLHTPLLSKYFTPIPY